MKQETIQFIGLTELEPVEQAMVNTLTTEYYEKIKRSLHNLTSLAIHIKKHQKGGKRQKFGVCIRVIAPTRMIESSDTSDWDLARVMHKSFKDIERRIEHIFRNDTSYTKREK